MKLKSFCLCDAILLLKLMQRRLCKFSNTFVFFLVSLSNKLYYSSESQTWVFRVYIDTLQLTYLRVAQLNLKFAFHHLTT